MGDEPPLSPLRDVECSGTTKVIIHLSDDSIIEMVKESDDAVV